MISRWKNSLWKTLWKQLSIFLTLYGIIALIYRFPSTSVRIFNEYSNQRCLLIGPSDDWGHRQATEEQMFFEKVQKYSLLALLKYTIQVVLWSKKSNPIPLQFLLGFYTQLVATRYESAMIMLGKPSLNQ